MEIVNLIQGTAQWHAHRAQHWNASDAPAVMGCSPYITRTELLHRLHTGLSQEVDAATQRRFDDGHRFEALARPMAEKIIGEELFPVTGVNGRFSASFDGLTMLEDVAFEHKTLNASLCELVWLERAADFLPMHYLVQMEHQAMVSGCERILFMASKWDGETLVEEKHCWYYPDAELRAKIVAAWAQLEADLAAYVPQAAEAPKPTGTAVTALPSVVVQVEGQLAVSDNFETFGSALRKFLDEQLIRKPATDQDFADLDLQIKALKKAEEALDAAEAQMLAQVSAVDSIKRAKDMLHKMARDNRLAAEKVLKNRKEEIKGEVVAEGVAKFRAHIESLNQRLGKAYMPTVPVDFAGAIKNLRTLDSLRNAVETELARAKIAANEVADRIELNLRHMREHAKDHAFLFADTATIVLKAPDDLQALVTNRIAEHKAAEEKRLEAERERIRQEEVARLEREQREAQDRARREAEAAEQAAQVVQAAAAPVVTEAAPVVAKTNEGSGYAIEAANVVPITRPAADTGATIKLGDINARLAPIQITAAGLAELGFQPVGKEKTAVLFRESDFPLICACIAGHATKAAAKSLQAA